MQRDTSILNPQLPPHLREVCDILARGLRQQLEGVIPTADELIKKMELKQIYKDVTFETLNKPDFLASLREAFPAIDWDKAYKEFQAAGEATSPVVPGGKAG